MEQLYILFAIILIASIAQGAISSAYRNYSKIPNSRDMTGEEAARQFLRYQGISDVDVVPTRGVLSDHYDPTQKVIRLSQEVFYGRSIASIAVATHEAGHAVQHAERYPFLALRNRLIPVTKFSSSFSWILIFIGFLAGIMDLILVGLVLFGVVALFQLVTLPVEFNASNRALTYLDGSIAAEDVPVAKKVLNAAALTYVAALLTSLLQILRFAMLISGSRRR